LQICIYLQLSHIPSPGTVQLCPYHSFCLPFWLKLLDINFKEKSQPIFPAYHNLLCARSCFIN
jgi:hypothetical protein